MDKKKILHIIPDLGVGGAEKLVLNLCKSINKDKFDITIISLFKKKNSIYDREAEKNEIKVIYLNKRLGVDLLIVWKLIKLFKLYKPDVINTHLYVMPYVLPAALLSNRRKIVHTVHNMAEKELRKSVKKIMKVAYKYFNVVPVAISDTIKKTIEMEYNIEKYKIRCIYNGVDVNEFLGNNREENFNIKLINVARFTKQKNHKMLIESFYESLQTNINLELILVGDGEEKIEIERLVKEKKIEDKVIFRGIQSDICNELNSADIYISSSEWEGLPISILEAMSSGLPIISTDVGGTKDIVKDNGILVENKNVEQLTTAIDKLVANKLLMKDMSNKSFKYSKLYDIKKTSQSYEELYTNL